MPWKNVTPMDYKIKFLAEYLSNIMSFSDLCRRYDISRKTGYKWINRYKASNNPKSLLDISRKPHNSPTKIKEEVCQKILKIREDHKSWGPDKIIWELRKKHSDWDIPCYSSVNRILKHNGYIKPRRKKVHRPHPGKPVTVPTAPNDLWTADFKGQFKTLDGKYCYPLTVADADSRFLLACQSMLSPNKHNVKHVFSSLFQEFGLPVRIRTDNGSPFASIGIARLSRLSVWWIRLGIIPELIEPGCPQQNGRHERMHRTLKQETVLPPAGNISAQQRRFNKFIEEFNNHRPHAALDMKPPAEVYHNSSRLMPSKLPQIEYPAHYEVRRVSLNGGIRWRSKWVNVGPVLGSEFIGLVEIADGFWDVFFSSKFLGTLNEKIMKIVDQDGKLYRRLKSKKSVTYVLT
jgi:transposase InsO family protein